MDQQYAPNPVPRTSTMAIISLVTGLMCIPLVSIILGHLARSEINKSNGSIVGAGIALAGLILGYLQLLFLVGWLVSTAFLFTLLNRLAPHAKSDFASIESQPLDMEPYAEEKYFELTGLITNLGGPVKSRYINIELKLEGLAGDFEKVLELNEHRIRDTALHIMGGYTYEDAQLDGFQERVRVDLKKAFSIVLKDYRNGESDLIRNIYFTVFVVQ
jgi:flagellar basal body-associated protein FliL